MIRLNEYLLSKTKTGAISFPKEPSPSKVVEFLRDNGFREYKDLGFSIEAASTKDPLYSISGNHNNPIIRFTEGGITGYDKAFVLIIPNSNIYQIDAKNYHERFESYEKFVEVVSEYFGW